MARVAVIGSGMSGISCAETLVQAGVEVVLLEKSRSYGGRCATRRWGNHVVDHGAQFFTIRESAFEDALERYCPNHIQTLSAPVLDEHGKTVGGTDSRYFHTQGNNRIAKAVITSLGLEVRLETLLEPGELSNFQGKLRGEDWDAVVCTVPFPQACRLLGWPEAAGYTRCLTAFFSYREKPFGQAQSTYAISDHSGSPLAWSACENHKAGRIAGEETVFVVQASPDFSQEHFDAPPETWANKLQELLEARWNLDASRRLAGFQHRWGFARRESACEMGTLPDRVFLTGDSLCESRIESVWLQGRATAQKVLDSLS